MRKMGPSKKPIFWSPSLLSATAGVMVCIAIRAFLAPSLGAYGSTLGQPGVEICRFGLALLILALKFPGFEIWIRC